MPDLSIFTILSLAAADAVNPCEIAVLTLVLINILIHDPKNLKKVLFAGLAFSLAIFLTYIVYGVVIIQFFKLVQALAGLRLYIKYGFAVLAIILGLLNIKDYFSYKPGTIGTEMPMSLRPRMKKLVHSITSAKGAFFIGIFVTLFLLPCTMGPYIVAGSILSVMDLVKTIPWLLIYNLVFVSPMLLITAIVYFGFKKVEDVVTWKDRNIRKLHLIAGILTILVGIAMIIGWV